MAKKRYPLNKNMTKIFLVSLFSWKIKIHLSKQTLCKDLEQKKKISKKECQSEGKKTLSKSYEKGKKCAENTR